MHCAYPASVEIFLDSHAHSKCLEDSAVGARNALTKSLLDICTPCVCATSALMPSGVVHSFATAHTHCNSASSALQLLLLPSLSSTGLICLQIYGVPTVRHDIKRPQKQSIANAQNYGNEPNSRQLINPAANADRGVAEQQYQEQMSMHAMRYMLHLRPLMPQCMCCMCVHSCHESHSASLSMP